MVRLQTIGGSSISILKWFCSVLAGLLLVGCQGDSSGRTDRRATQSLNAEAGPKAGDQPEAPAGPSDQPEAPTDPSDQPEAPAPTTPETPPEQAGNGEQNPAPAPSPPESAANNPESATNEQTPVCYKIAESQSISWEIVYKLDDNRKALPFNTYSKYHNSSYRTQNHTYTSKYTIEPELREALLLGAICEGNYVIDLQIELFSSQNCSTLSGKWPNFRLACANSFAITMPTHDGKTSDVWRPTATELPAFTPGGSQSIVKKDIAWHAPYVKNSFNIEYSLEKMAKLHNDNTNPDGSRTINESHLRSVTLTIKPQP